MIGHGTLRLPWLPEQERCYPMHRQTRQSKVYTPERWQPVRLRGHHLLCMLTYVGKGYTPNFSRNFALVMARISARRHGILVRIVATPDDLCRPLCGEHRVKRRSHCYSNNVQERDRLALVDAAAVLGIRELRPGMMIRLSMHNINTLRAAYRTATLAAAGATGFVLPRRACDLCTWHALCDRVAITDYPQTHLRDGVARRYAIALKC